MSSARKKNVALIAEPLRSLAPQPVEWLWPYRLGLGKLAMLDGDPQLGKSLLALDLCARLSRGAEMPDGSPGPGPANCLILNAEDSFADTVLPRLEAMGADIDRIFRVRRADDGWGMIGFPRHTAALDALLAQTGARLVVIDPLTAFLGRGAAANSDQGTRRALTPLAKLAERHGAAVLLLRHLNKLLHTRALYRGGGSIGLLAACRSGWLVGEDPEAPGRHVLAQVKNNLAPAQPSLAFEVVAEAGASPTLRWHGPSPWRAAQLLAETPRASPGMARARARDFLTAFLKGGPRTSHEVWAAAQAEGLSERTVNRAKEELSIRSQRVRNGGAQLSYWLLEGQYLPGEDAEFRRTLDELEKQYPRPCALDEPDELQ